MLPAPEYPLHFFSSWFLSYSCDLQFSKVIIIRPITIITTFAKSLDAQLLSLVILFNSSFFSSGKTFNPFLPGSNGWQVLFSLQTSATLYLVSMLERRVLYWKGNEALNPTEIFSNHHISELNINSIQDETCRTRGFIYMLPMHTVTACLVVCECSLELANSVWRTCRCSKHLHRKQMFPCEKLSVDFYG